MITNLNGVLRLNPETFVPKKAAQINFGSTDYNCIIFGGDKGLQKTYNGHSSSQAITRKISEAVFGGKGSCTKGQTENFANALITSTKN